MNYSHIKIIILVVLVYNCNGNSQYQPTESPPTQIQKQQQNTWQNITLQESYENLNEQIETLSQQFIPNFLNLYHVQTSRILKAFRDQLSAEELKIDNIQNQTGNYLLLLGKMYLYDILPKSQLTGSVWNMYQTDSRYLLAYFYLRVAAEKYQNSEAYYYLALLDFYKLNPHQVAIKNLQKLVSNISQQQGYNDVYQLQYHELLDHLRNQRFISVQHNLFLSSMLGHHGASLTLANMMKQGIGMDKNCTSALSYYLSIIKDTYVDSYEFRSAYSDQQNFQKQLYAKRKVVFQNQQNADVVSSSQFFDSQTIKAVYQLAENYFIGRGGFKKNFQKAAELYSKLAAQDHKNSMAMLAMCYFKGQGVPIDRKRARVLFQHSSKVSISQAMLIVMDYFQIQSKGNRENAIKKMKQIYQKKKQLMNPILKYLYATLIIKGDVKQIKIDDGVLMLGSAAKEGHLMAKISMGLLFSDGIDVNFDCSRAVNYFSDEGLSHPFFMDKFYMARIGLKNNFKTFALIKYLELSTVGDTNSFINALYILEIQKQSSLDINQNSWNIKKADNNILYQKLKKQKIVPDIYTYFQKEFSFFGRKQMKYQALERLLAENTEIAQTHLQYIKNKIIKVCAITKQNSLMNFYDYKISGVVNPGMLSGISNGQASKLHVLQARYLLGQYYHTKAFQSLSAGRDHTKQQYKALQQYKRSTNSEIIGKILFYLQEIKLSPFGINFQDQLFQFSFINDLLTYTFVLSIVIFILYYKRSKKLDQIHKKELQRRQEQIRVKNEEEQFKKKFQNKQSESELKQSESQQHQQNEIKTNQQPISDKNQPQIVEQRPNKLQGHRIGSSLQQNDNLVLREAYQAYEVYKFNQESNQQESDLTQLTKQQNESQIKQQYISQKQQENQTKQKQQ